MKVTARLRGLRRKSLPRRVAAFVLAAAIVLATAWGVMALWFQLPGSNGVRFTYQLDWHDTRRWVTDKKEVLMWISIKTVALLLRD